MDAVTLLSPGGDRSLPPGQPALRQPNSLHPRMAPARSRASAVHISPRHGKVSFCSSPLSHGGDQRQRCGGFLSLPLPHGAGQQEGGGDPRGPCPREILIVLSAAQTKASLCSGVRKSVILQPTPVMKRLLSE